MILMLFGSVYEAMHSSLFIVKEIEVRSSLENPPLDQNEILQLAKVSIGSVNLFEIDMRKMETRLLSNDLIRDVKLEKRPFHSLTVSINFRDPKAIFQGDNGKLSYIDENGMIFGSVELVHASDFVLLSGFSLRQTDKILAAIHFIKIWERLKLDRQSLISTVFWDSEKGFRVLVSYPLNVDKINSSGDISHNIRSIVDFGQEIDSNLEDRLLRVSEVFRYMSLHMIVAHQIMAGVGKKVFIKPDSDS